MQTMVLALGCMPVYGQSRRLRMGRVECGGWAWAKAPQYGKDSVFEHLTTHPEWPEVAATVIEATQQTRLLGPVAVSLLLGHLPTVFPSEQGQCH